MRVAAIDLGSNSVHMVIADLTSSGGFRIVDREAEMVRLGAGAFSSGRLSAVAMGRTASILAAYKRFAESHQVEEVLAFATSAIREAQNGEELLRRIGRKTGIWVKVVPGEDEARLIYTAALHSVRTDGRPTLLIDIGGGSVEIVVGRGPTIDLAASLKLGALRMTEEFLKSDPPTPQEERRLEASVRESLAPLLGRIRRLRVERAVGTSGTILTLGRMALASQGGRPDSLHHASVDAEAIRGLRRKLVSLDLARRVKIPGSDERRADILPAGAIVLDTLLSELGLPEVTLCDWALREGILLDFAARRRSVILRAEAYPDVRRRSVVELAERCAGDTLHARHVARLALDLFDATRRRHGLARNDRLLLEYAALLHDIGHHISHNQHHKHSYYLIKNGGLRGFEHAEIEVLANVARYHRGGGPGKRHAGFATLPRGDQKRVAVMAGLLRLADALDRSHRQRVRSISGRRRGDAIVFRCATLGDVQLEMWGAQRRADLLEEALGAPVRLEFLAGRKRDNGRRGTLGAVS